MIIPKTINTYCPHCRAHTPHKVKLVSKGRRRTLASGEIKHARKLKGHGGKRAGVKTVKKQGKRQTVTLACTVCKKKHVRTIGSRTRKKLEVKS